MPTIATRAGDSTNTRWSGIRRVNSEIAAKYLGVSVRTLEDWRQSWTKERAVGTPEQRKGPAFVKVGKRVLYDVGDLERFLAARQA